MSDNIFVVLLISIGGLFALITSFVLIFIRNQNKMLRQRTQLQQAKLKHQQELLQTIIVSQEAERKRIGQDLHDDVGTALSNLRITIEMFSQNAAADRADFSNISKNLIDKIIQNVRHVSHNLSPPGIALYGFISALEELCEFITATGGLHVTINNQVGAIFDGLDETESIALYRVMEELLNNTLKHSAASHADIGFAVADGEMLLNYHDNGRGISPDVTPGKGMGMQNIESRLGIIGAAFTIGDAERTGFNIQIRIQVRN
jgi:signal transduction histidine kinase